MSSLDLVKLLYGRAGSGDWDAVEQMMSPDLIIHEPASVPFGGEWRGRDALKRLYMTVMGKWENPKVQVKAFVGDDLYVVALLDFTMTSKLTGRTFTQPVAEVSKVEGGLVTEMRVHYFDAAEIAREAGGTT